MSYAAPPQPYGIDTLAREAHDDARALVELLAGARLSEPAAEDIADALRDIVLALADLSRPVLGNSL
jgi:hypothetical protein